MEELPTIQVTKEQVEELLRGSKLVCSHKSGLRVRIVLDEFAAEWAGGEE